MSKRVKAGDPGGSNKGAAATAEVYQLLWQLNDHMEAGRACLRDLGSGRFGMFSAGQVREYTELLEEAQHAINSYLLGELETRATEWAGRLFGRRKRREAKLDC